MSRSYFCVFSSILLIKNLKKGTLNTFTFGVLETLWEYIVIIFPWIQINQRWTNFFQISFVFLFAGPIGHAKNGCSKSWCTSDWDTTTINCRIFWDFLMFYQTFLSPQVKRCAIISYKHGMYKLPQELPKNLRLRKLGNIRRVPKPHKIIT